MNKKKIKVGCICCGADLIVDVVDESYTTTVCSACCKVQRIGITYSLENVPSKPEKTQHVALWNVGGTTEKHAVYVLATYVDHLDIESQALRLRVGKPFDFDPGTFTVFTTSKGGDYRVYYIGSKNVTAIRGSLICVLSEKEVQAIVPDLPRAASCVNNILVIQGVFNHYLNTKETK